MTARARRGALAALLLAAAPLAAQNPPPRPDSVRVPIPAGAVQADTARRDTVPADSAVAAPLFPAYPRPDTAGFWKGSWTWDREALARFHGISLLDLLARVPGVVVTRGGGYGQPAGVAPFAAGGGRTRLFMDGWEVDPLASATLDLQEVSLTELEEVRVERRLDELRIEVLPFRLPDRRPYSQIEAGVGDPQLRILRGLYSDAIGDRQVVTLGFDVADTRRYFRQGAFGLTNAFARWSWLLSPDAGVQVEYRTTGVERDDTAFSEAADRRALVVRGRWRPSPALALDAMLGRNWRDARADDDFRDDLESNQLALRALLGGRTGWVEGTARLRSVSDEAFPAATSDLELRAGVRPVSALAVEGSARAAGTGGESGVELQGSVRVGPSTGASLFASLASGKRGVGIVAGDSVVLLPEDPATGTERRDTFPVLGATTTSLGGLRAGAEWSAPGVLLGAALVRLDPDRVVPFGLPLDRDSVPATPTAASTGFEAYASTPLFRRSLRLEGWYTRWTDTGERPYLPEDQGRLALEFHDVFYTGNLEPTLRVEAVRRGAAVFPERVGLADPLTGGDALRTGPYTLFNVFLQVRVIDVRAFLILENVFDVRTAAEVPGRPLPGLRAVYGVRWHFRN